MTSKAPPSEALWDDALLVTALVAVDPAGLGGVWLRARVGPARDAWIERLRQVVPQSMPLRRVPPSVGDDRLLGGLDLPATLAAGRPVGQRGLLADADGGLLLIPMAERLDAGTTARIARAMDERVVVVERDGVAMRLATSIGVVALDEAAEDDEAPPSSLTDRLAFHIDLSSARALPHVAGPDGRQVATAAGALDTVDVPDAVCETLCAVASAFGIASLRAPLLAMRAARACAALHGRAAVSDEDVRLAARLVLAPRATCLPETASEPAPQDPPPPPPPSEAQDPGAEREKDDAPPQDLVLEAVRAALPPGLLAQLLAGAAGQRRPTAAGKAGASRFTRRRGRPAGAIAGELQAGARLALIETLRAAAPWQPLRRREAQATSGRVLVRREDFRIRRFIHRSETTTIFAVDASGSSALHRMAEAKGAVELLLADCYVRRDQVALIAFRGDRAELVLPPTRSLVRAKRGLAGLPGGGGTPLAAGLDAAAALADGVARRGQTPVLVVLTDGRANIARDGSHGRAKGEEDATTAARLIAASGLAAILVDTSPRPQRQAEALARAMKARYLPLPSADAALLSAAVKAASA